MEKIWFSALTQVVTGVFLALVTTLQQCVNTTDGILIPWKKVALVCYWRALLNKVETTTLAQKVCLSSHKKSNQLINTEQEKNVKTTVCLSCTLFHRKLSICCPNVTSLNSIVVHTSKHWVSPPLCI